MPGMDGKSTGRDRHSNDCLTSDKMITRKEIVQKKKAIQGLMKASYAERDHLSPFQTFCHYCRNGMKKTVYLYTWNMAVEIKSLLLIRNTFKPSLKLNMEGSFGFEWSMEEKVKR